VSLQDDASSMEGIMKRVHTALLFGLAISLVSACPSKPEGEDSNDSNDSGSSASDSCVIADAGNEGDSGPIPDSGTSPTDAGTNPADSGPLDAGPNPSDAAVPPTCGDGTLQTFEQCELFELRGATCETQGFSGGQLACTATCTYDTSACTACGNGILETGELCDATALGGATCDSLLGTGHMGNLTCTPDCSALVTDACNYTLPAGDFETCDSTLTDPCTGGLSCLSTGQGDFCLDGCALGTAGACGVGEFCLDVGETGNPQGACAPQPENGDVCTDESGCSTGNCEPTFGTANTQTVCVDSCTLPSRNEGQGSCAGGYSCVANPGGHLDLEPGDIPCAENTETRDCNVDAGFGCHPVPGSSFDGGTQMRCGVEKRFCSVPQDFFGFQTASPPDESLCDLENPTGGGRYCGLLGSQISEPARVRCFPIFSGIDSVGTCIGFCDKSLNTSGTDLDCGTDAECVTPDMPQFYVPSLPELLCGSPGVATCGTLGPDFDACVDFGNGPACARPSKVCAPLGSTP
jgi:hypothetical protein